MFLQHRQREVQAQRAIPVLHTVVAVPITRTIRGLPELALGRSDGMPTECAASFDNLRVIPKANLVDRQMHPRPRPHARRVRGTSRRRRLLTATACPGRALSGARADVCSYHGATR